MKQIFQQQKTLYTVDIVLTIKAEGPTQAEYVFAALWQQIEDFNQRFSRFISTSELSKMNASAGQKSPVSSEMVQFLIANKKMGKITGGLFNPLVLPGLQRAGYKGSFPHPEQVSAELDYSSRTICRFDDLAVGDDWVRLPKQSAFDSGGLGKGYLLDQLGKTAERYGIGDYWFSLGGDILCSGNEGSGGGWEIGIASATDPAKDIEIIKTDGEKLAVATSATTKRRRRGWHHIIDPATSRPARTDILAATVVAKSGILADALAKSAVILGSQKALSFIKKIDAPLAYLQVKGVAPIKIGSCCE